jgi:hypothetical protein
LPSYSVTSFFDLGCASVLQLPRTIIIGRNLALHPLPRSLDIGKPFVHQEGHLLHILFSGALALLYYRVYNLHLTATLHGDLGRLSLSIRNVWQERLCAQREDEGQR